MKKKFICYILLMITLMACSDRETVKMGETISPVLISAISGSDVEITEDNLENLFSNFTWSAADFGFQSAKPEYNLKMDLAGSNFEKAISLGITKANTLEVLNSKINLNLLKLGVSPGEKANVQFRLFATIHKDVNAISNIIAAGVTPVEVVIEYPKLYVTGTHNGWGFNDASLIYSMKSNEIYEGYIYMDNGVEWSNYKLSYQPNWESADAIIGDPDGGGVSGTLQIGNWGGNNINVTQGPGYYRIIANLVNLTYSNTKTQWAITGDFSGWSFVDMSFDLTGELWSVTANMTPGGFKFIANHDWGIMLGDNDADGHLDPGTNDNNIQIAESGNYTIVLNLSKAPYTYTITKN